ncbi:MAG: creatininase family protein [Lachnospiraceae bacterium]|nr:creatininase family protein [Lachnospiraceae bacterium]
MSFYYGDKTRDEIAEYAKKNAVVILPVGTTEEHGAHLPVETDAIIARYFGDRLGEACEAADIPVLVLRPICYGFSMGVVRKWPGCPNVDIRVLTDYIHCILSSLVKEGFTKLVMLDCHGNHDCVLRTVMRMIVDEYNVFPMTLAPGKLCADVYNRLKKDPEGDIHGGEYETSCILHIAPELVHTDKYTDVDKIHIKDRELLGPVSTWGLMETKTGLFGDPTPSTAELGKACLDEATRKGVEYIRAYYHHTEASSS